MSVGMTPPLIHVPMIMPMMRRMKTAGIARLTPSVMAASMSFQL